MKRFGLSAEERIKSRKDFEQIYSSGQTVFSSNKKIKAVYIITTGNDNSGVKIAAVVSRKAGKAFWRNRVKRLIKESYRLNKEIILNFCDKNRFSLKIVFSSVYLNQNSDRKVKLKDIEPPVVEIMNKIILKHNPV